MANPIKAPKDSRWQRFTQSVTLAAGGEAQLAPGWIPVYGPDGRRPCIRYHTIESGTVTDLDLVAQQSTDNYGPTDGLGAEHLGHSPSSLPATRGVQLDVFIRNGEEFAWTAKDTRSSGGDVTYKLAWLVEWVEPDAEPTPI